jgi:RNA polymerase sigma factor (sigma-70 family)
MMDDLLTSCEQIAAELNRTECWNLPPEALAHLARAAFRFVTPDIASADLRKVIYNYFHDGPRVEMMAQVGLPEAERAWETVRTWYCGFAVSYGVAPVETEDVAQQAWHQARRRLPSYAFRGRFHAWLRAIILRACHQWYRRPKPETVSLNDADWSDEVTPGGDISPERMLLEAERRLLLEVALQRLLSHRDLLILRYSFLEPGRSAENGDRGQPLKWTDERIAPLVGLAPASLPTIRERILQRLAGDPALLRLVEDLFGTNWLKDRERRRGKHRKVSE